jgi:hypothetical protein
VCLDPLSFRRPDLRLRADDDLSLRRQHEDFAVAVAKVEQHIAAVRTVGRIKSRGEFMRGLGKR